MDDLIILDVDYKSLNSNTNKKKEKEKYNPITSKLTDGY
jgi:hypothetical protein